MTIVLNTMSENEYKEYYDHLIKSYADQNIDNGDWDHEEALGLAKIQINALLPKGLNSDSHNLYCIFNDKLNMNVGFLWVQIQESKISKKAFIMDIEIFDVFQGKGMGEESLKVLEDLLKSLGVNSLSLHVFAKNTVARNLYLKFGFKDMSFNMVKTINGS